MMNQQDSYQEKIEVYVKQIIKNMKKRKIKLSTMESCSSGSLISSITDVEGASEITEGGYVTYSNLSKINVGVNEKVIKKFGVYSKQTSVYMAKTCLNKNNCEIGIGVTGTFNNIDINNKDSIPGKVDCSIVIKINSIEEIYSKQFYIKNNPRFLQKKELVYKIIIMLNDIIVNLK